MTFIKTDILMNVPPIFVGRVSHNTFGARCRSSVWIFSSISYFYTVFFLFVSLLLAQQPQVGQGLLIHEVSRSHTISITVGRTPLRGRSARRSHLHLKTNKTNNRQTSLPPGGFETTISAGERPQTHALERAANGTCFTLCGQYIIYTL